MKIHHKEFEERRHKLLAQLAPNSMAILFSAPEILRNGDTHYAYRQDSDFYYLTGFSEAQAVAVFIKEETQSHYFLFNLPRDKAKEIWTGHRAGQEGAIATYGAQQAFSIETIDEKLPELMANKQELYYTIGLNAQNDARVMSWLNSVRAKVRSGVQAPAKITTLQRLISEMRLIKSEMEITWMQKAIDISIAAHMRAMTVCKPGMRENQIEAELAHEFGCQGARFCAYPSIVAAGVNACILHYTDNNMPLKDGELLLIDAGAEFECYAADITRTFPINGQFTTAQRDIYQLVLDAQLAGIRVIKAGVFWDKIQETMIRVLTEGLVNLGLLKGLVDDLIEQKSYRQFYMHNSGHWLGMDVHDVGDYKITEQQDTAQWRPLVAGMTITVEPGLYIPPHSDNVDKKWWGIGVRIEDDVLVTAEGCDVLSQALPKTVSDIEALMRG